MDTLLESYAGAFLSVGLIGGLLLIQLLVADALGILAKRTPGTPIEADHGLLLFRAHRAHANTNESVAAFICLTIFSVAVSAPAAWLNALCWIYVVGRIGHMLFYYANLQILRSIAFAVGILALIGIFVLGIYSWLS